MNTFPTIDTGPKIDGFEDSYSDEAVAIADLRSGYPVINELFTFNPRNFTLALAPVSQEDKETVMTFYQANKGVPFNWLNEQDNVTYEVVFASKPTCQLYGEKDKWMIAMKLRLAF